MDHRIVSPEMYTTSPATSPLLNYLPTIPPKSARSNMISLTNPVAITPNVLSTSKTPDSIIYNKNAKDGNDFNIGNNHDDEIVIQIPTHEQLVNAYQKMEKRKQQQHKYYVKRKQEREYLQSRVQQLEGIIHQQNEILKNSGYQSINIPQE